MGKMGELYLKNCSITFVFFISTEHHCDDIYVLNMDFMELKLDIWESKMVEACHCKNFF